MKNTILDNKIKKKCIFVKDNGVTCNSYAMKDSKFCYFHNPDVEEERLETKRNGGKSKVLVVNKIMQKPIKLDNAKQVTKFYSQLVNEVMSGEMDLRLATGIGYLLNGLLKSMEMSEFGQRLEMLENKITEQNLNN